MPLRSVRCVSIIGALVALTSNAHADDDALGPDAAASALFEEGRALIDAGDWEAGCAKLELSMQRYPAASTLLNLAQCAEKEGAVATAWARYKRGLVLSREVSGDIRREALIKVAEEGIAAMEPRLPRLLVSVRAADNPEPPPDTAVLEQDKPILMGEPVVLDPGHRGIVIRAPGFIEQQKSVDLVEGKTVAITVTLQPAPEPPPEVVAPPPAPITPDKPAQPGGPPWWAWASGGLGIVLTGASVGFALDASNRASELEGRCGDDLVCDEDPSFDPEPENDAKNRSIGFAVGFGAGAAVGLGVAIVGFAIGSDPDTQATIPTIDVAVGPGSAAFRATVAF